MPPMKPEVNSKSSYNKTTIRVYLQKILGFLDQQILNNTFTM